MRRARSDGVSLLGAVAGVVAGACCAGLPALAAALGGIGVAAVIGMGGAIVLVGVAAGAVVFLRLRRRRACQIDAERPRGKP